MSDCGIDCREARLRSADAALVGKEGRGRQWQANEILRKASAYFAQAELDRPFRR
jgi:hypothetical protein